MREINKQECEHVSGGLAIRPTGPMAPAIWIIRLIYGK